jgi:hypothetical protein
MITKNVLILATISFDESVASEVDGFVIESLQRGLAEQPEFKATCTDARLAQFPHPISMIGEFQSCPMSQPDV